MVGPIVFVEAVADPLDDVDCAREFDTDSDSFPVVVEDVEPSARMGRSQALQWLSPIRLCPSPLVKERRRTAWFASLIAGEWSVLLSRWRTEFQV